MSASSVISAATAAATAAARIPLTRWDHLFADARKAAVEGGGASSSEDYAELFQSHVLSVLPDLTRSERDLLEVDSHLDCQMRDMDMRGDLGDLYAHLNFDALTGDSLELEDMDKEDARVVIVHQLRRVFAVCPVGWAALCEWVASDSTGVAGMQLDRDAVDATARQARFYAFMNEAHTAPPAPDLALFPADARIVVKRKLEHLTAHVANITATQAAAEVRAILADVEQSLPEAERTIKRARN